MIKQGRKPLNDATIFEGIKCMNDIRESTYGFIDQVISWQKMYVHNRRPHLMRIDYLADMVHQMDFIGTCRLRKYLNFGVSRGNIFILPLSTGRTPNKIPVSEEVMTELDRFVNPDIDRLLQYYHFFQKALPAKQYNSIFPLQQWANRMWNVHINVYVGNNSVINEHYNMTSTINRPKTPLTSASIINDMSALSEGSDGDSIANTWTGPALGTTAFATTDTMTGPANLTKSTVRRNNKTQEQSNVNNEVYREKKIFGLSTKNLRDIYVQEQQTKLPTLSPNKIHIMK
jgi:hypothetical protein